MSFIILLFTGFAQLTLAADSRTLIVNGDCQRRVSQDRVSVTISAEFLESNATTASSKATQQYNQLRDKIKKLNLKDAEFSTSEYSLNEDFEWIKNIQKSKGFRARQSLTVETSDLNKIGEALKIAQELGIKRVSGLNTFVSQELFKSEREACLEEAFKNAKSKADRLAKVSNSKVGPVIEMNESGTQTPEFQGARYKRMDMVAEASLSSAPSIDSKSEMIQTSLRVIFQIL